MQPENLRKLELQKAEDRHFKLVLKKLGSDFAEFSETENQIEKLEHTINRIIKNTPEEREKLFPLLKARNKLLETRRELLRAHDLIEKDIKRERYII